MCLYIYVCGGMCASYKMYVGMSVFCPVFGKSMLGLAPPSISKIVCYELHFSSLPPTFPAAPQAKKLFIFSSLLPLSFL